MATCTFNEKNIAIARKACQLGATDSDLAEMFEVTRQTIHNWKVRYEEFRLATELGKEQSDNRVEQSLYHRACGYSHDDTDIRAVEGQIIQTPTTKHYAPDVTAAIFWLKNRRPDKWRDKQEVEQTTTVHNIMPVPQADSVDDWESAAKQQQDSILNPNDD